VKAGIERTKAQGNHYGRKRKPFNWPKVKERLDQGQGISSIAKELGYSRAKIYRVLSEKTGSKTTTENRG